MNKMYHSGCNLCLDNVEFSYSLHCDFYVLFKIAIDSCVYEIPVVLIGFAINDSIGFQTQMAFSILWFPRLHLLRYVVYCTDIWSDVVDLMFS